MKIVIDIEEAIYKECIPYKGTPIISNLANYNSEIIYAVANGTPLPKGHGRLIDADKCIRQAWNDFYKHEDEWEKKDPDYIGVKRFHDQNGFECCLKTIGNSPTIIEADKAESEE